MKKIRHSWVFFIAKQMVIFMTTVALWIVPEFIPHKAGFQLGSIWLPEKVVASRSIPSVPAMCSFWRRFGGHYVPGRVTLFIWKYRIEVRLRRTCIWKVSL